VRAGRREQWNRPILWPIALFVALLVAGVVPAVVTYVRKEGQIQR